MLSKLGGEGRDVFEEPAVLVASGQEQKGARRSRTGRMREPHRWYGWEICFNAIVGILRWWKRGGSLISELSFDPEVMMWRCRFQGAAAAAVDYVQQ